MDYLQKVLQHREQLITCLARLRIGIVTERNRRRLSEGATTAATATPSGPGHAAASIRGAFSARAAVGSGRGHQQLQQPALPRGHIKHRVAVGGVRAAELREV